MRRPRLRAPADQPVACYHCLSRVVDRQFLFGPQEKERFVALMRELEAFCEVRVLTFCVLSNHFHLLVEVPRPPESLPSVQQVLEKLSRLSGHQDLDAIRQRFEQMRQSQDAAGEAAFLARFHARMWNLSAFMKLLKQRFTQWYNGRHAREGTLWQSRFKSVLVEGAGPTLLTMAGYIDLNPVRAGLVHDPKDYRWSGYGEAMAGVPRAEDGVQRLVYAQHGGPSPPAEPRQAFAFYRMHLYQEGLEQRVGVQEANRPARVGLSREAVLEVLRSRGTLPVQDYLKCRVRYFCDGAVLGSREFVEQAFLRHRSWFGHRRQSGARPVRGLGGVSLWTWRALRLRVFG